jgi:hypothetical protein
MTMENPPPIAPEIGASNSPITAKKVRLLSLANLDGRTSAAKRVRALIADIAADLGGADHMTAAEHEIARRAAIAGAVLSDLEAQWLSGRPIDLGAYSTLANTQSRLLKMLGLQRRSTDITPSLSTYLAARAAPPTAPLPAPIPAHAKPPPPLPPL